MFARHLYPRFFDAIVGACREVGFTLNVAHEVDNLQTGCALVAAGLGVCFVPSGLRDDHGGEVQFRPVKPRLPHVEAHLVLAYNRQAAPELVPLFVDVVREVARRRHRSGRRASSGDGIRARASR